MLLQPKLVPKMKILVLSKGKMAFLVLLLPTMKLALLLLPTMKLALLLLLPKTKLAILLLPNMKMALLQPAAAQDEDGPPPAAQADAGHAFMLLPKKITNGGWIM